MCFHGNQHPSSIKHPFISLYSKYHPFMFICLLNMTSPIFPSLDDIYCMSECWGRSGPWGVDGGWMPLPTHPQRYCDPASLARFALENYKRFQATRQRCLHRLLRSVALPLSPFMGLLTLLTPL